MKNRYVISLFTLILVIFGLFATCSDPTKPDSNPPQSTSNYMVKFEANSGSPAPDPQNITHGSKVVMPSAMTKTGYGFGGWYKEADCINQWDFTADTVIGTITLYAKWDTNYYTVDFEANGGSPAPDPQNITHDGKVVMPSAMTKTGYGFGRWYKEADCTNEWNFATNTVTGNITLYAKWDMNYYTIKFNANGGSPVPNSQNIVHDGTVVQPPAMTKTSYGFGGWYKEADCTNEWNFATDTVTSAITLYAQWNSNIYTETCIVNFQANGGSPAPDSQYITHGGTVVQPPAMTKSGYGFGGWYKEVACTNQWNFATDTVTNNIILYAKWEQLVTVPGTTLADKLQWLKINAASNSTYMLEVTATHESLAPQNLSYTGRNNITIRLKGIGAGRVIELSSNGSLFSIQDGVTLILEENLILRGKTGNDGSPLVLVNSGSTLTMNQGIKISGNTSSSYLGGGVNVDGGTFIMSGGEISGNTSSSYGGGVCVNGKYMADGRYVGGTFTMNGGAISGNTAINSSSDSPYGGGVYVARFCTFIMNGGEISGNTSSAPSMDSSYGGGVRVDGTFTMNGGKISGNTVTANYPSSTHGGGVHVFLGTFIMNSGEISGNTVTSTSPSPSNTYPNTYPNSYSYGGGVYVYEGTFTMSGGTISGNTATATSSASSNSASYTYSYGGGVYMYEGTFTMSGGAISGNTATATSFTPSSNSGGAFSFGGGVYVFESGILTKSGGTITGYASDTVNGNVVKRNNTVQSNRGYAVYANNSNVVNDINSSYIKRKETTAGSGDNLSYNGRYSPPVWDGAWDN